jgi:hypothetical protein
MLEDAHGGRLCLLLRTFLYLQLYFTYFTLLTDALDDAQRGRLCSAAEGGGRGGSGGGLVAVLCAGVLCVCVGGGGGG